MVRRSGRAVLTPAQHAFGIRRAVSGSRCRIRRGVLTCIVDLQPTPVSRRYTVRITHRPPLDPVVEVIAPVLRLHPGAQGLPHVYTDGRLCLYEPGEWKADMPVASSILPWASEWLFHYEIWLVTGAWTGGGDWPSVDQEHLGAAIADNDPGRASQLAATVTDPPTSVA